MGRSAVRILVADDYQPWRRFVCAVLQNQPELQVISEASDGLEAVWKAQELQPDLVLLDIGLPKLHGIEAARQIRERASQSKILFLTENCSLHIAREALRTGAGGYVVKSDAASELLPAVEAVRQGKRFVSASLAGHDLNDHPTNERTANHARPKTVVAPLPPQNVEIRHEVEFYPDDRALVSGFARLTEAVLKVGNAVIVIATDSHRAAILQMLRACGGDVSVAIEQGSCISLDAADTVKSLMVNDLPDPVRCVNLVGDLILGAAKSATREHYRVAICGECAPVLLVEGNAEAAVRLEHLWDEVTKRYHADTLCGYLSSAFPQKESSVILERICAEHSAVHGRALGY